MVDAQQLENILESETGLHWTVSTDKADQKVFVAVSFKYELEYQSEDDKWRLFFEDDASKHDEARGDIEPDRVPREFRSFVSQTYNKVKR